ncbi:hypothetical protein [Streptomyces nanshensis]|uniref:Uncharacterized protein n=1 Tax=Streptomyces nanshensis TaxID=518642 RepID=A0A1E7L4U6_9ACTN|nr:hypothetical protein [Streptomyces nanshensis]OEV11178.1 hypothetical protein AN218_14145 [Streptomyces nanshensis]
MEQWREKQRPIEEVNLDNSLEVVVWMLARTAETIGRLNVPDHDAWSLIPRLSSNREIPDFLEDLYVASTSKGDEDPDHRQDVVMNLTRLVTSVYFRALEGARCAIDPEDPSEEAAEARILANTPITFCAGCAWAAWSPAEADKGCDCPRD